MDREVALSAGLVERLVVERVLVEAVEQVEVEAVEQVVEAVEQVVEGPRRRSTPASSPSAA